MSFTVDLIIPALPADDDAAWESIESLRERYHDDAGGKAAQLVRLYEALVARYPCLCSYADDDPEIENCPWADGPLINNFAGEMGMVAIVWSRVDEVFPFVLEKALALGITVVDGQAEEIYRPEDAKQAPKAKPWWRFW